jgi:hypothetical protein
LALSYISGLGAAVFAWGTLPGLGLLGFALLTHLTSTADALRQPRFPALGSRADRAVLFWWLLAGLYAPLLAFAAVTAWPGAVLNLNSEGYLVNLWAFRGGEPESGAHVWFRPTPRAEPRLGVIVGRSGQLVEWSGGWLRVDGVPTSRRPLATPSGNLRVLSFHVPRDYLLVRQDPPRVGRERSLLLVDRARIIGRAWAQSYPVRQRRLLP